MKKSRDTIGNRTRDLPVCSAVPQPLRHRVPHALTVPLLFYILTPTCFGSSFPSSERILDPSELLKVQIEWVVYHIMCDYVTCVPDCRGPDPVHRPRNHTLCDIPPTRFVFQVTQKGLRCSLMMASYCRNM
jgi:hypothetical protein